MTVRVRAGVTVRVRASVTVRVRAGAIGSAVGRELSVTIQGIAGPELFRLKVFCVLSAGLGLA